MRPGDPLDLARGIVRLLADPDLRRHRARMGHSFLEDYSFGADAVLNKSVDTYRALMDGRHRQPGAWPPDLSDYPDYSAYDS